MWAHCLAKSLPSKRAFYLPRIYLECEFLFTRGLHKTWIKRIYLKRGLI